MNEQQSNELVRFNKFQNKIRSIKENTKIIRNWELGRC